MTAFRAALGDRDPRIRRSVREVPAGEYDAAQLRGLLQAAHEVLGDDSLYYAWPDCVLTQKALAPESLQPAEFKARLTDPDPGVRRSVWLTLYDDAFMNGEPQDFFHVVLEVLGDEEYVYAWPDCLTVLDGFTSWFGVLWSVARVLARTRRMVSVHGWPAPSGCPASSIRRDGRPRCPSRTRCVAGSARRTAAVLDAFGLRDPVEVSLRIGFAMWDWANRRRLTDLRAGLDWPATGPQPPYTSHCPEVFVTPALDGWTLVLTDDEMLDESHEDAYRRCAELSRRFGAAHWYNEPANDYAYRSGWCVAENGAIVHHATYGDMHEGVQIGPDECYPDELRTWLIDRDPGLREPPPTDETPPVPKSMRQRLLHISMFGTDPGESYRGYEDADSDSSNQIPRERIEFSVSAVTWRLSVGLQTLGPYTRVEGTGVLAVLADPPPKRYGTPPQSDRRGFRR